MAATISPVVHGPSRTTLLHSANLILIFVGSMVLSSALLGLCVSCAGTPLRELEPLVVGICAVVIAPIALAVGLEALGVLPPLLPSSCWQVPRFWILRFRPPVWHALFGAYLGIGFLTQLRTKAFYVLLGLVALLPPTAAAAAMGIFGLARAVPIVLFSLAYSVDRASLQRVTSPPRSLGVVNGMLLCVVAGVLLVSSLAPGR